MATPKPSAVSLSKIKSSLLRPALTSNFQCWFYLPDDVFEGIQITNVPQSTPQSVWYDSYLEELISLSCCEASLPGLSLMTNEITGDYTGVTERFAYRRQFDDRADFTFYVDHNSTSGNSYNVIMLFEKWIRYIATEAQDTVGGDPLSPDFGNPVTKPEAVNHHYRIKFPDSKADGSGTGYRGSFYINKFERDFKGTVLQYHFLKAYPVAINSMPVSYESSELLKCTVSFTYNRYLVNRVHFGQSPTSIPNAPNESEQKQSLKSVYLGGGVSGNVWIPSNMTYQEAKAAGQVYSNPYGN